VTTDDIHLKAHFEDGSSVVGESTIAEAKTASCSRIKRVDIVPSDAKALPACIEAIEDADMIVLGPGSLYTSVIPNLLVDGVVDAIMGSDAVKLYICNVMTQPGETEGYSVSEHISELFRHAGGKIFDCCLINIDPAAPAILERYKKLGADSVVEDLESVAELGVEIIMAPIAAKHNKLARHDPDKLAKEVLRIFCENAPTKPYDR